MVQQLRKMGSQSCKLLEWKRETGAPSTRYSCYGQLEQFAVYTVDRRSVCEDAEMRLDLYGRQCGAINQLSMDGAHSLVVDSGVYVHLCPKSCATGLDLRSASGTMLKVW